MYDLRPQYRPRHVGWFFLPVALSLLLVTGAWALSYPDRDRIDRDEGLNLMKARLVARGYHLYTDIWSDQPPAYTYALVGWGKLFNDDVSTLRTLSALFSTLAMTMVGLIVWRWSGTDQTGLIAGLTTLLLLLGTRQYLKLSSAIMIGLPAIAVALIAVLLVTLAGNQRTVISLPLCLAGGVIFALSMQIKLFTFILIPMTLGVIWRDGKTTGRSAIMSLAWGIGLCSMTAIMFCLWGSAWREQLIAPHVGSRTSTFAGNLVALLARLAEDFPITIAAVAGLILAGSAARRAAFPAILWVITSLIVLANAKPLWSHHRVMLTIPFTIIIGICLALFRRESRVFKPFQWVVAGIVIAGVIRVGIVMARSRDDAAEPVLQTFHQALRENAPSSRWVVSDDPHPVYAAGLCVPPEIAVLSAKRLWIEGDIERLIGRSIDRYQPRLVYLSRHQYSDQFHTDLQRRFEKIAGDAQSHLYRRRG